jgi:hypothetical protein
MHACKYCDRTGLSDDQMYSANKCIFCRKLYWQNYYRAKCATIKKAVQAYKQKQKIDKQKLKGPERTDDTEERKCLLQTVQSLMDLPTEKLKQLLAVMHNA